MVLVVWLAAFFSHGHFLGHLKDSPIGFFQQQLLTHGSFFPTQLAASLQPWSSGSLPWTDFHSWSPLFPPARPLEQTLKWLPASSPSHTDHIWPMKEQPMTLQGSRVTSPMQQQLSFAPSCQPGSLSLLISSLVNMG